MNPIGGRMMLLSMANLVSKRFNSIIGAHGTPYGEEFYYMGAFAHINVWGMRIGFNYVLLCR
jgi:hypothetical protein